MVISGWGDVEGMREELLEDWGDMLERWDGKDRARPSRVVKLCRKVSMFCVACSLFLLVRILYAQLAIDCRVFLVP